VGITVVESPRNINIYFSNIAQKIEKQIMARAAEAMHVVIQAAVLNAKEFTATRGTAKSGKAGRVDTNAMLDAFKGEVTKGANEVAGRFGFLDAKELYFKLQTSSGFMHGDFIEPTFALRDAADIADDDLRKAVREAIKEALR